MTILKDHLKGDTLNGVERYSLTVENYKPAIQFLINKYGNQRKPILNWCLYWIALGTERERQIDDIACPVRQLISIIHMLEALDVGRSQFAVFLVPIMRAVLPAPTRLEWAKTTQHTCLCTADCYMGRPTSDDAYTTFTDDSNSNSQPVYNRLTFFHWIFRTGSWHSGNCCGIWKEVWGLV